jgi:hypothetical protein
MMLPSSGNCPIDHYSVAFGCPTLASVIQTVARSSSMQYQIRPPAVTSYCHCSISTPFIDREPSEPLSGCWRESRCRGSPVIRSHAVRALAGAAEQICSQPLTASLVENRKSQPPGAGGGATRSLRLDTSISQRQRNRITFGIDRTAESARESWVCVDLGGALPLAKQLTNRGKVVDHRDGDQGLGQLVDECLSIWPGKKCRPWEDFVDRGIEARRAVNKQVPQQPRERVKGFVPFLVAVKLAQPQCGSVTPAQYDVMVGEFSDDLVRLAQELREWTLDHSHVPTISEVLQKSMPADNRVRHSPFKNCGQLADVLCMGPDQSGCQDVRPVTRTSRVGVRRFPAVVALVSALGLVVVGAGCSGATPDVISARPIGDTASDQAADRSLVSVGAAGSTVVSTVDSSVVSSVVSSVPPAPSTMPADEPTAVAAPISVHDLPVAPQSRSDSMRSSLATSPGLDTGQIERLVPISSGLALVGSSERFQQGSIPVVVVYGLTDGGLQEVDAHVLDVPGVGSASAVDLVELDDGSLRVLGWEDHPAGPAALLWHLSPGVAPVLEHRFGPNEFAGDAQLIELDTTGRTWLVSTRRGFDGKLDVALETPDGWVSKSVDAGFVGNIQAAAFGDRLTVWSSGELLDADGRLVDAGWIARTYELDGDELQVSQSTFAPPGVLIGNAAWVGDEYVFPVTETAGESTLWSTADGVSWSQLAVPTQPGMLVRAVVDAAFGTIVLGVADHPDADTGLWTVQALVVQDAGVEPWSAPFPVDTLTAPWSTDMLVEAIGSSLVVIDRPPRAFPTMLILDSAGSKNLNLAFGLETPHRIERVVDLMPSPDGVVAVVETRSAAEPGMWNVDQRSIYLLSEGQWQGVTSGYVQAGTMWRGRPLFAIPSESGTLSWYRMVGSDVEVIGSTNRFTTAKEMVSVNDELFVVGVVDDRQHLFHGRPDVELTETPGLPDNHMIVELCADDDLPYVVVESMLDGSRLLATVRDGSVVMIDELSQWLADSTLHRRPPLCWVTKDAVGVMGEFDWQSDTTTPVIAWQPIEGSSRGQSTQGSFHTLPGSVGHDVSPGQFITNIVGVAHDRHGSFDAVWWSVPKYGQLIHKSVFGGNGRQEALAVLQVSDGFLIGGTDNGEPIIWIVPDA